MVKQSNFLLKLDLYEGIVINWPSKKIRSPYLADVEIEYDNKK